MQYEAVLVDHFPGNTCREENPVSVKDTRPFMLLTPFCFTLLPSDLLWKSDGIPMNTIDVKE